MARNMADDDMIVVIIGDETVAKKYNDVPLTSFAVKQEPLDEAINVEPDMNVILETVTKHGEYIEIKQEDEDYDVEYLDDEFRFEMQVGYEKSEDPDDIGYIPQGYIDANEDKFRLRLKQKPVKIPELQIKNITKGPFYVEQIRLKHPEMRKNSTLLVEHLFNVMKKLKPPPPPPNYFQVYVEMGVVTYQCNICYWNNDTIGAAARHYQAKHGEKYLNCFACGAGYTCTPNLYKHEKACKHKDARIVLKARGRYLGRKGKGRPYTTSDKFTAYEPIVPVIRSRFYCTKCPASFRHKGDLVAHENCHEGLRPFQCNFCPAAYTSDVALRRHLQTHGDYQYICDHCGRAFKLKTLLISHVNTHRPLRKFPCQYCPRRFAQKTALNHHQNKVHLNLPPAHACPVCPKRYARMSHVRDHMKRQHDLSMITRKMFFKNLPTLESMQVVKPAKIILNSETEPKPINIDSEDSQGSLQDKDIQQLWSNAKLDKQGKKVYEVVIENDDKEDMMKDLLKYMQLKKVPQEFIQTCEVDICVDTVECV